MAFCKSIIKKIFSGHERTIKAKKNALYLIFFKGWATLVSFLLIPITLRLLDDTKYGVWITLFNMLSWISIFDIGLGNGLRNKFTECMTLNKIKDAKEYVSTAYIAMSFISFLLIFLFFIPWYIIDWSTVFNISDSLNQELTFLIGIAFSLTSLQFTLKIIGSLLTAIHKPALSAIIVAVSNSIVLVLFLSFANFYQDELAFIGFTYTFVPLFVFLIASVVVFNSILKNVKPSIKSFKKQKVKDLFSLGLKFFFIQIAVIVLFSTDSIIITQILSPAEVTSYNIILRYFSVITFFTGILLTPLWSAYTEAVTKKDLRWIKKVLKDQMVMVAIIGVIIISLYFSSDFVLRIWLNRHVKVSSSLLIGMALFTFVSVWNNIFSFVLNGMSKTKVQIWTSIIAAIINIPLSIKLGNYFGNGGVIFGTVICMSLFAFFGAKQVFNILSEV